MDWRGIEWVVPVYKALMLLAPVYGFIALRRRVKHKRLTKARALVYYTGLVFAPVAMLVIFFFGLVGLEEVTKTAIIPEELARSVFVLIGVGLVVWLASLIVFGTALTFIRRAAPSPNQANPADAKK